MGFTTPSNYSTVDATVRLLGLGRQDSNLRSRDQNPVPCRLATPQRERRPSLFVSAAPPATPRLYRSYLQPSCMQDGIATLQKLYPTGHRFANPHEGRHQPIRRASRLHFGAEDAENCRTASAHRG